MDSTLTLTYAPIFKQFETTWAASKAEVDKRLIGHPFKRLATEGVARAGGLVGTAVGLTGSFWGAIDSVRDIIRHPKDSIKGFGHRALGGFLIGLPVFGAATFAGLDPITATITAGLVATGVISFPWANRSAENFVSLVKGTYNAAGSIIGGLLTRGQKAPAPQHTEPQLQWPEARPLEQIDQRYGRVAPSFNDPSGAQLHDINAPIGRDPVTGKPYFAPFDEAPAAEPFPGSELPSSELAGHDEFPTHPEADARAQTEHAYHPGIAHAQRLADEGFDALLANARAHGLTGDGSVPGEGDVDHTQRPTASGDRIQDIINDMERMGPIGAPLVAEPASQATAAPQDPRAGEQGLAAVAAALATPESSVAPAQLPDAPEAKAPSRRRKAASAEKKPRVRKPKAAATPAAAVASADKPRFAAGQFSQADVNAHYYNKLTAADAEQAQRIDDVSRRVDQVLAELARMRDQFGVREEGTKIPRAPRKPRAKAKSRVPHAAAAVQAQLPAEAEAPRMPRAAQLEIPKVAPVAEGDDIAAMIAPFHAETPASTQEWAPAAGPRPGAAPIDRTPDHLGRIEPRVDFTGGPVNDGRAEPYLGPSPSPSAAERHAALRHDSPIARIANPAPVPANVGDDVYVHDAALPAAAPMGGFDDERAASPIAFRVR